MLSVGEILKKQREKLKIDFIDVEGATKIREKFLNAVESNNWRIFSSKVYIEGIIKNYSTFLNLNPAATLAFFRRDYERRESVKFKGKLGRYYFTPETKKIILALLFFIFFLFFGYFGYQLKMYFSPPKITIVSPKKDVFNKEERVKIVGKTEKDATITIFGERLYQNKEGIFEFNYPLQPGKNELVIEVVGANGKKTIYKKTYFRSN